MGGEADGTVENAIDKVYKGSKSITWYDAILSTPHYAATSHRLLQLLYPQAHGNSDLVLITKGLNPSKPHSPSQRLIYRSAYSEQISGVKHPCPERLHIVKLRAMNAHITFSTSNSESLTEKTRSRLHVYLPIRYNWLEFDDRIPKWPTKFEDVWYFERRGRG